MSDSIDTPAEETAPLPEPKKKSAWMIVLGVVVALGIAGAGWAVLYGPNGNAPGTADDGSGSSDESTRSAEPTETGSVEESQTIVIEPEGGDTNPVYDPNEDPPLVEQYTGIITDVTQSGGSHVVTVDYVQFVIGDEAKQAAEAQGDTVSASGLYVVNDNPLTREREVAPDISVRVTVDAEGKPSALGRSMSVSEWAAAFDGPQAEVYRNSTYIFTLTNGTVTMLEQLYLP